MPIAQVHKKRAYSTHSKNFEEILPLTAKGSGHNIFQKGSKRRLGLCCLSLFCLELNMSPSALIFTTGIEWPRLSESQRQKVTAGITLKKTPTPAVGTLQHSYSLHAPEGYGLQMKGRRMNMGQQLGAKTHHELLRYSAARIRPDFFPNFPSSFFVHYSYSSRSEDGPCETALVQWFVWKNMLRLPASHDRNEFRTLQGLGLIAGTCRQASSIRILLNYQAKKYCS